MRQCLKRFFDQFIGLVCRQTAFALLYLSLDKGARVLPFCSVYEGSDDRAADALAVTHNDIHSLRTEVFYKMYSVKYGSQFIKQSVDCLHQLLAFSLVRDNSLNHVPVALQHLKIFILICAAFLKCQL